MAKQTYSEKLNEMIDEIIEKLTEMLNSDVNDPDYLQVAINLIAEWFGADHGKILVHDKAQNKLKFMAGYPKSFWDEDKQKKANVYIAHFREQNDWPEARRSLSGHLFEVGRLFIIEDLGLEYDDERNYLGKYNYKDYYLELGENAQSEIVFTLEAKRTKLGIICLSSKKPKKFLIERNPQYKLFSQFLATLLALHQAEYESSKRLNFQTEISRLTRYDENNFNFDGAAALLKDLLEAEKVIVGFLCPGKKYAINFGESDFIPRCKKDLIINVKNDQALSKFCQEYTPDHQTVFLTVENDRAVFFFSGPDEDHSIDTIPPFGYLDVRFAHQIHNFKQWLGDELEQIQLALVYFDKLLQEERLSLLDRANISLLDLANEDLSSAQGIQKAIDNLVKSFSYSGVHLWMRSDEDLVLKYPAVPTQPESPDELSAREIPGEENLQPEVLRISLNEESYIGECYSRKMATFKYSLDGIRLREVIPEGAASWMGVPLWRVISDDTDGEKSKDTSIEGVISCFDRKMTDADPRDRRTLVTQLDLPVLEYISAVVTVLRDLENALEEQITRIGFASHEITAAFGVIRRHIELLYYWGKKGYSPDEGKEKPRRRRRRSPERLIRNTNQLMDFLEAMLFRSRYLSNDWTPKIEDVDIYTIIAATTGVFRAFMDKKREIKKVIVEYERVPKNEWFFLSIDRWAVGEVLLNLLMNAAKYCDNGSTIWVRHKGKGILQIINRGPGIPEDETELIFKKNYQATNVRENTEEYQRFHEPGALFAHQGLGLYFCKSICDRLEYSIKVADPNPENTTFELSLLPEKGVEK